MLSEPVRPGTAPPRRAPESVLSSRATPRRPNVREICYEDPESPLRPEGARSACSSVIKTNLTQRVNSRLSTSRPAATVVAITAAPFSVARLRYARRQVGHRLSATVALRRTTRSCTIRHSAGSQPAEEMRCRADPVARHLARANPGPQTCLGGRTFLTTFGRSRFAPVPAEVSRRTIPAWTRLRRGPRGGQSLMSRCARTKLPVTRLDSGSVVVPDDGWRRNTRELPGDQASEERAP